MSSLQHCRGKEYRPNHGARGSSHRRWTHSVARQRRGSLEARPMFGLKSNHRLFQRSPQGSRGTRRLPRGGGNTMSSLCCRSGVCCARGQHGNHAACLQQAVATPTKSAMPFAFAACCSTEEKQGCESFTWVTFMP